MKPITIFGGGLAGLALGIGLRQHDVPAKVLEAGQYPRHRVCGEFISGRGQRVLESLGLDGLLIRQGRILAHFASFHSPSSGTKPFRLPIPALCLSRHELDALLAREFRRLGGELNEHARWTGPVNTEGTVVAKGRRKAPSQKGWHWYGLKIHASNVPIEADLEMHLVENGYVGLCRLPNGEVNVCGLFRRHANDPRTESANRPFDRLRGPAGSILWRRLEKAALQEISFCSVAALPLRPERAAEKPEYSIGDALTMIAPLTGNGMSMAFEAAEMAVQPLVAYSRNELSWREAKQRCSHSCDLAFAARLRWGAWLQTVALSRARDALVGLGKWPGFVGTMFRLTR